MDKYIEFNHKDMREKRQECISSINKHYNYCAENQLPYIELKKYGKNSDVHFDYISYDMSLDEVFLSTEEDTIWEECKQLHKKYDVDELRGSGGVITFYGVASASAPKLAKDLYQFIYELVQNINK